MPIEAISDLETRLVVAALTSTRLGHFKFEPWNGTPLQQIVAEARKFVEEQKEGSRCLKR